MCTCVGGAVICMCPPKPEENIRSPRARVACSCEYLWLGIVPWSLQLLSHTQPSPRPSTKSASSSTALHTHVILVLPVLYRSQQVLTSLSEVRNCQKWRGTSGAQQSTTIRELAALDLEFLTSLSWRQLMILEHPWFSEESGGAFPLVIQSSACFLSHFWVSCCLGQTLIDWDQWIEHKK